MRSWRLPTMNTLAQFDFRFQPSVTREQIEATRFGSDTSTESVQFLVASR